MASAITNDEAWAAQLTDAMNIEVAPQKHGLNGWSDLVDLIKAPKEKLKIAGFCPVQNWPGCFVHKTLHAFLTVYVDDFKMSGPKKNLAIGWELISENIDGRTYEVGKVSRL